jgi:hypothetical protein
MYHDKEINALSNVYEILKGLDNTQIKRILDWVTGKFEMEKQPGLKADEREVEIASQPEPASEPEPTPVEAAEPAVEPIKKRRGRKPGKKKLIVEDPGPQETKTGITGLLKYDSLEAIFLASTVKTTGAKILLASAYLQENENFKELSSYDVTSRMKNIGQPIKHSTIAIKNLMSKKPPLLLQTGTFGSSKLSRKKFRVTEAGLRTARNYINE